MPSIFAAGGRTVGASSEVPPGLKVFTRFMYFFTDVTPGQHSAIFEILHLDYLGKHLF